MAYLKRLDCKSATIDKSMMSNSNAGVENCNKKLHKIFEKLYEVHKKTLSEESKKLALNNVFTEDLRAAAFETL